MDKLVKDYIDKHLRIEETFDYASGNKYVIITLKIPFFIKSREVTLNHELIKEFKLEVDEKEGFEIFSTPNKQVARKFKHGEALVTNSFIDKNLLIEQAKRNIINHVKITLKNGYIEYPIFGLCEDVECREHECGTEKYILDGFCDVWPHHITTSELVITK